MNQDLPAPQFPSVNAASLPFDPSRAQLRSQLFYYDVDLTNARAAGSMLNLPLAGNVFYIDQKTNSGFARVHFQDQTGNSTPVTVYPGFIARVPFTQLAIENDAQPGATLRIIYGTDLQFRPSSVAGVSRPAWYDRNPKTQSRDFSSGGIGPHASSQRWIYTVPAGRKALVEATQVFAMRNAVAAPADRVRGFIQLNTSDAGNSNMPYIEMIDNTVGARIFANVAPNCILTAGDSIAGNTTDLSTGGTVIWSLGCKITEYDA